MLKIVHKTRNKAFTLIELLVVIAIIGILAGVVIASLNSARLKARNAKRVADMNTIRTALYAYFAEYGCLPIVNGSTTCGPAQGTYSEANGSWDNSNQGDFLTFLKTSGILSDVPLDPINDITGDGSAGGYGYMYHCYAATKIVALRYFREPNRSPIIFMDGNDGQFNCK